MVHVVHGHAVQHDQVFFRSAAAYVQAGKSFLAALHAGQQLQGFDYVGLAEEHRGVFDLRDRNFHGTEVGGLKAGVLAGDDACGVQGCIALQGEVEGRVALHIQLQELLVIADVGDLQPVLSGRQGEGVESEFVGHRAGLARQDAGADQRLARGGVGDVAAEGHTARTDGLGLRRSGAEDDVAPPQFPAQAAATEALPEGFFQRHARLERLQFPVLRQGAPEDGVIDEADIISAAQLLHACQQVFLGTRR